MTTITVCTTCRTPANRVEKTGDPDGAGFLPRMKAAAAGTGVTVRGTECLMGCEHGCNVAVQAAGKLTYVLGRFEGSTEDAGAVVAFAEGHAASRSGQVPFRQWPQGVKGHFISRVPPLEDAAAEAVATLPDLTR